MDNELSSKSSGSESSDEDEDETPFFAPQKSGALRSFLTSSFRKLQGDPVQDSVGEDSMQYSQDSSKISGLFSGSGSIFSLETYNKPVKVAPSLMESVDEGHAGSNRNPRLVSGDDDGGGGGDGDESLENSNAEIDATTKTIQTGNNSNRKHFVEEEEEEDSFSDNSLSSGELDELTELLELEKEEEDEEEGKFNEIKKGTPS